ncbi:MAG TPA: DUF2249 domain-containing protein [Verrucomicrobiae bacterium]|nr:DUF2249 domain-containing protein [Verrucomicrobiae bacterium]
MNKETVTLDVREDLRSGREPFSKIMRTVSDLQPEQSLLLIAPFEPVPLFAVLEEQGFAHEASEIGKGHWEVLFTRNGKISENAVNFPDAGEQKSNIAKVDQFIEVDARRLEPPQPMVKILEALAALPERTGVRAFTDRRPLHLYAQLEARGFTGQTEEQTDGSFITHIRRN